VTNNEITNRNQGNVIFNLASNYQSSESSEPEGTVKATITNFSMTIEEVKSGENGLIFRLNDEGSGFIVRGSAATKGAVNIPDVWKETEKSELLPVTEIAQDAFKHNMNITSANIGNNVEIIGGWAFNFTGTTSVSLPNSLIIIGEDAFCQTKLTSVTIPDSVEIIEKGAFFELHLSSVVISQNSNLRIIGEIAFVLNDFTNILIPARVESIYESFGDCKNLTSVIIMTENPPILLGGEDGEGGDFTWLENEKLSFHVPESILGEYQEHLDWGKRYGPERFYAIESIVFSLSDYLANNYPNNQTVSAAFKSPLSKTYGPGLVYTVNYNAIEIKGRDEDWQGLDISIDNLNLSTNKYKITVSANLLEDDNTKIIVQGAEPPYDWLKSNFDDISDTSVITVSCEIPSDFLANYNYEGKVIIGNQRIRISTLHISGLQKKSVAGIRINNIIIENLGLR
ncbi:MAG: leucine-rich repeat domain-containing protein, partial [Treponema sp.]|nr:leucine-rich repeat domain-containing protein [Treponema sp.]